MLSVIVFVVFRPHMHRINLATVHSAQVFQINTGMLQKSFILRCGFTKCQCERHRLPVSCKCVTGFMGAEPQEPTLCKEPKFPSRPQSTPPLHFSYTVPAAISKYLVELCFCGAFNLNYCALKNDCK